VLSLEVRIRTMSSHLRVTSPFVSVVCGAQYDLQQHNEKMSCEAMAQLLSNTLYYKRFFPTTPSTSLAGLDAKG